MNYIGVDIHKGTVSAQAKTSRTAGYAVPGLRATRLRPLLNIWADWTVQAGAGGILELGHALRPAGRATRSRRNRGRPSAQNAVDRRSAD